MIRWMIVSTTGRWIRLPIDAESYALISRKYFTEGLLSAH